MTEQQQPADTTTVPDCPRCQGPMWDNRVGKRNPKAPDFKCKDRECDGVIWPPRAVTGATGATASASAAPSAAPSAGRGESRSADDGAGARSAPASAPAARAVAPGMPACPVCGGPMWDDRTSKRNPRAPDFKCRNKPKERGGPGCEGVIWPSRDGSPSPFPASPPRRASGADAGSPPYDAAPASFGPPPPDDAPPHDDDDLPF